MKNLNIDLLNKICSTPGVPGYEKEIRNLIISEIRDHVDDISIDNLGNVIAIKKGRSADKKVMAAAHMDEIGFIVRHIDENGFIRFATLGGFDPKTLTAQRVVIHGREKVFGVMGTKPIHVMSAEERTKLPKIEDYYIDLGMKIEQVQALVRVGDPITRHSEFIQMGDCINCKSLDNRVSVYVLVETLKKLQNPSFEFYGVFTVQEEVGIRGANVAAHQINPDFGIALDTTIAFDLPGSQPHEQVTKLGEGVAIKILDASAICDYRMVEYLKGIANTREIKWQPELLVAGGTDTAGIQRMGRNGAITGAISIPTRHLHQVIEMSHTGDIRNAISLLISSIESIDSFDWTHQ